MNDEPVRPSLSGWCPYCKEYKVSDKLIHVSADGAVNPAFVGCRDCNRPTLSHKEDIGMPIPSSIL